MIVKNRNELAGTPSRSLVLDIIEAGISRVRPQEIMASAVSYDRESDTLAVQGDEYPLSGGRIFVIGGGKASAVMAEVLEAILSPERITAGVVTCKSGDGGHTTRKIEVVEAGHPVPDSSGIEGTRRMLDLKDRYAVNEHDLVLCLISGGGSALMPCPVDGVTLEDKQAVTGLLLGCGADIHEINTVRKHLSRTKGGGLCAWFAPAPVVSLILSDVIGNDLDVIASGPTSPDSSTFRDARAVLEKYNLTATCPASIADYLEQGSSGKVPETPETPENCRNYIIGDNRLALDAMADRAREAGLKPVIVTAEQKGETTTVARERAEEILAGKYAGFNAIILGGETTPVLPENHGTGGRNQHYAAVSMQALKDYRGEWTLAGVGTDGSDYLPDAAGAIVDSHSLEKATAKGLDVDSYISRYDSYTLFRKTGESLVVTGSTGTNVGDVVVYILG
jgi:glycerate 2-kinase